MDFRAQVALDNQVFLQRTEFAEPHLLDGRTVDCVLVDNEGQLSGELDQVGYLATRTLSVTEALLPKRPVIGKTMMVDNESHTVLNLSRAMGMLTLTLTRAASR
ncbi:MAG TPA: hypothetical protein VGL77_04000 [Armatimonadota bacterium]|jgi:hypothetical protein